MLTLGDPSNYEKYARLVMDRTSCKALVLLVIEGDRGSGMCHRVIAGHPLRDPKVFATLLRTMADAVEAGEPMAKPQGITAERKSDQSS